MVVVVALSETALRLRRFSLPVLTFIAITSSVVILNIKLIMLMTVFFVVMMAVNVLVVILIVFLASITLRFARRIAPIQVDVVLVRVCDLEPDVLRHQGAL